MRTLYEWMQRLRGTLRSGRSDGDLEQELRAHAELAAADARRRGQNRDAAVRAARLAAGGAAQAMEALRDQRGLPWFDDLRRDVHHAVRSLRRTPAFTAVALLTLTLGIGANTAIFSIVNGVLLRPLAYPSPERLMFFDTYLGRYPHLELSPPEYLEFREMTRSFSAVGAYSTGEANVATPDRALRVRRASVDGQLLAALGIQATQGRIFGQGETETAGASAPAIVILSHELWQSAFGGRPIVGRAIDVDGRPHDVVGILPSGTDLPDEGVEIWLPLGLNPANRQARAGHYLQVVGRLRDSVTPEAAQAEVNGLMETWGERIGLPPGRTAHVFSPLRGEASDHILQMQPLERKVLGGVGRSIWVLQVAAGFVLLVACANVAGLLLARAETRQHELAVRRALGASRARLIRQFITDGVLLSFAGGALGLVLASTLVQALIRVHPSSLPRTSGVSIDWLVLVFTFGAAAATGVLFGLAPLAHARAESLLAAVKAGASGTTASSRLLLRRRLVVAELALAVTLVIGAALLARTVFNLLQVDGGFDRSRLVTFATTLPQVDYPLPSTRARLYERLVEQLRGLPGVDAASAASGLPPMYAAIGAATDIEGYTPLPGGPTESVDYYQYVMADFFETMGIPIVAGRAFEPTDAVSAGLVAVVNQTFVHTFLAGKNPIGQRFRRCRRCDDGDPWFTVIGVAADVKQRGLDRQALTEVYTFAEQAAIKRAIVLVPETMNLLLRTSLAPENLAAVIGSTVRDVDPSLPVVRLRDMEAVVAESLSRPRFLALLVGAFAGLALLLAVIGTYGVLSYIVGARRREIGIRIALGATRSKVVGRLMRHGLQLTAAGVAAGVAGALGLTRLMTSLLFGVQPTDTGTIAGVVATITVVAAVACWLPAWRASRLDPNAVLRAD